VQRAHSPLSAPAALTLVHSRRGLGRPRSSAAATGSTAVRVQRGGHDIPAEDIERRYWRGLRNFFGLYQPLANRWVLCDNSGRRLEMVARGGPSQPPTIYDAKRFERTRHAADQK